MPRQGTCVAIAFISLKVRLASEFCSAESWSWKDAFLVQDSKCKIPSAQKSSWCAPWCHQRVAPLGILVFHPWLDWYSGVIHWGMEVIFQGPAMYPALPPRNAPDCGVGGWQRNRFDHQQLKSEKLQQLRWVGSYDVRINEGINVRLQQNHVRQTKLLSTEWQVNRGRMDIKDDVLADIDPTLLVGIVWKKHIIGNHHLFQPFPGRFDKTGRRQARVKWRKLRRFWSKPHLVFIWNAAGQGLGQRDLFQKITWNHWQEKNRTSAKVVSRNPFCF